MEDTLVKPGHYAYQFRVDIGIADGLTTVMQFMQKYNVKYYIVGAEVSTCKKEHFQCILWFEKKINSTKLRNWWKGKTTETKQPVSLTSAKKIRNLAQYTMKESNFTTNLTQDEVSSLGKWSQKPDKLQWTELLDKHAKAFDPTQVVHVPIYETYKECEYEQPDDARVTLHSFVSYMLDFYKENQKRPNRATLQYLAWKHGYMTNYSLIKQWF